MTANIVAPLQARHAEIIAGIHGECFDRPWSGPEMARMLCAPAISGFGAGDDAYPDGFILGQFSGEEGEILTIAVRPRVRQRGIGRALIAALIESAREKGVRSLFLEVASDNVAALHLYETSFFVRKGLRKAYYSRGPGQVDAHILERILT